MGLEEITRCEAALLQQIFIIKRKLEQQLFHLLRSEIFAHYLRVMEPFGFGPRIGGIILTTIYPLEKYLLNGRPEIVEKIGRISGKPTKRHLSERRFLKALGVAPRREESGERKQTKKDGSGLCRIALWQWIFMRIEVKKNRLSTPIGKQLGAQLDREKQSKKPVSLIRARIASKAAKLLFRALVEQLHKSET